MEQSSEKPSILFQSEKAKFELAKEELKIKNGKDMGRTGNESSKDGRHCRYLVNMKRPWVPVPGEFDDLFLFNLVC